jgi:uncharacterized membrane protein YkoI
VTSAEKENENGQVMYDIELKHEGRKYEMDIKGGRHHRRDRKGSGHKECTRGHYQSGEYPKATIKEVMEVMEVNKVTGKEEKPIHYEVTIDMDGKKKEVIVSLDGKSVKAEGEEKNEN